MRTAEFVSSKHPDKICDFIADSILDAYLEKDKNSRCAVEVMGGHNLVVVNGEITSKSNVDIKKLVRGIVGENYEVILNVVKQSPEIAQGVDAGGAGDQGIMMGYACNENEEMVPLEYYLARKICKHIYEKYPYDGKVQVTLDEEGKESNKAIIVASFQNVESKTLSKTVEEWIGKNPKIFSQYIIYANSAGDWSQGGFDADTGLSGRKIAIDNYGPEISTGGGSFSGKDYTKVDRTGAYIARRVAVDLLKKYKAKKVYTKLAYIIGKPEPVMAEANVDGVNIKIEGYDLSPKGIYKHLKLNEVKFSETSNWGHFGRGFNWD